MAEGEKIDRSMSSENRQVVFVVLLCFCFVLFCLFVCLFVLLCFALLCFVVFCFVLFVGLCVCVCVFVCVFCCVALFVFFLGGGERLPGYMGVMIWLFHKP